jgi:organic hydroperoxide reductase OsmC/OhrA
MSKQHIFKLNVTWTGNNGVGTAAYDAYRRDFTISASNKADILCSADPVFRGDGTKYNPEDMLIAALSSCHMLWYFHLCADAGIVVETYEDTAEGELVVGEGGKGQFSWVKLHPKITLQDASRMEEAKKMHEKAHEYCFIARSVNFPVEIIL